MAGIRAVPDVRALAGAMADVRPVAKVPTMAETVPGEAHQERDDAEREADDEAAQEKVRHGLPLLRLHGVEQAQRHTPIRALGEPLQRLRDQRIVAKPVRPNPQPVR